MKFIKELISHKNLAKELNGKPRKITNTQGVELLGYIPEEFVKAALLLSNKYITLNFDGYIALAYDMKAALDVNISAVDFLHALFKNYKSDGRGVYNVLIDIYSKYFDIDKKELENYLETVDSVYAGNWERIVPDEDKLTEALLSEFYNSLPEWSAATSLKGFKEQNPLGLAYKSLPIALMSNPSLNIKNVFDYGGNDGLLTSALSNCTTGRVTLIEFNKRLLNLAKYKDEALNINNVNYVSVDELTSSAQEHEGLYDLGCCFEVLEHAYDVEKTVKLIASLIRKDGWLLMSTSFALPMPSHLKKNIKYDGPLFHQLMSEYGFVQVEPSGFPIPLLNNMFMFKKVI
ncbi:MAG: methyltransferase domain-containing protein [Defluviitaleaceae bacterium]|nr:methyltransferase domain-containing protein [Defluviitaleaceae bacterium]